MNKDVAELAASLAKPFERCFLKSYWDPHPHGLPTQGWGRLVSRYSLKKHLEEGKSKLEADQWLQTTFPLINQETADLWLEEDLKTANKGVLKYISAPLTVNQEAALTDFAFNVGVGNLQASTLRRLVNRLEYSEAATEFLCWNKAGGIVLKGLTKRRVAESKCFSAK